MNSKICPTCKDSKAISLFNSQGKYCLECHRARSRYWRLKNPEKQAASQRKYKNKIRKTSKYKQKQKEYYRAAYARDPLRYRKYADRWKAKSRAFIIRVKRRFGCSKCQERDVRCLHFHHLSNKVHSVADMPRLGFGIKAIKMEMRKCIIVCGNCHAKEH